MCRQSICAGSLTAGLFGLLLVAPAQELSPPAMLPAGDSSKLAPALQQLLAGPVGQKATGPANHVAVRGDRVQVEVWLRDGFLWDTSRYGSEHGVETVFVSRSGSSAWARVPISELQRLSERPEISYVTTPPVAVPVGLEGAELTGAVTNYHDRGFRGKGVKVAIVDVGFARLSEAPIPAEVIVQKFNEPGSDSHGTVVAGIVHRMAPEASLYLYRIGDGLELAAAAEDCIGEGVHVINVSIVFFNASFYDGTGKINDVVEKAAAAGILWVNGAGNHARHHYRAQFRDTNGDGYHEFAPGDPTINIVLNNSQKLALSLVWNERQAGAGDYEVGLFKEFSPTGSPLCRSPDEPRERRSPDEPLGEWVNCEVAEDGEYHITVRRKSGSGNHTLVLFVVEGPELSEHHVAAGSIPDPTSEKALSVGAVAADAWDGDRAEPFSSRGPTNGGQWKPDLCGPDRVDTIVELPWYLWPLRFLGLGRPGGTSVAAPHVAGAAALLIQEFPGTSPEDLRLLLEANARPFVAGVRDTACGAGRLNLPSPLARPDVSLASGIRLRQAPPHSVGQQITVEFTIANRGSGCIHLAALTAGGRRADGAVVNFPFRENIVLCEAATHTYSASLTLPAPGLYRFFPAYKTHDGIWNTSIPAASPPEVIEITVLDGGRVLVQKLTSASPPGEGCNAPPAADTFDTNTPRIHLFFHIDGVLAGDRFQGQWIEPDGSVFRTSTWNPAASGGSNCYVAWIEPVSENFAGKTGTWKARVSLNAVAIFEVPFRILPATPPVALASLSLSESSVTAGASLTGRVTLTGPAPRGGASVGLQTNNSVVRLPCPFFSGPNAGCVILPAGQTSASFTIQTTPVSTSQTATITASYGGVTRTATITINPPGPQSPWLNRTFTIDGTVTLEGRSTRVRITMGPSLDSYLAQLDNALEILSPIILVILFDGPARISGNSITLDRVNRVASNYFNLNRGANLETITSATLTLTVDSAAVGAPVRGSLRFSTSVRTIESAFTGTVLATQTI